MTRSRLKKGHAVVVVAAMAMVIVGLAGANAVGLRLNATPSMSLGLWRMARNHAPLRRGDIVVACLPDTAQARAGAERGYISVGNCPNGFEPLVKPIAAVAGDVVVVSAAGVAVNGQEVHGVAQLAQDSSGRPLRGILAGAFRVAHEEVWLLSGHDPRSFDSRYFGPVPEANVQGIARPLWVLR